MHTIWRCKSLFYGFLKRNQEAGEGAEPLKRMLNVQKTQKARWENFPFEVGTIVSSDFLYLNHEQISDLINLFNK